METFENNGKTVNLLKQSCFYKLCLDACSLQIGANIEKNFESEACNAPALCFEIVENADKVFGKTVEKVKYENYECYLHQGK